MYGLYQSLSESVQNISETSPVEVLTLCPCPPETSEHIPDTDKAGVDGGILIVSDTGITYKKVKSSDVSLPDMWQVVDNAYPVNGCSQPFNLE